MRSYDVVRIGRQRNARQNVKVYFTSSLPKLTKNFVLNLSDALPLFEGVSRYGSVDPLLAFPLLALIIDELFHEQSELMSLSAALLIQGLLLSLLLPDEVVVAHHQDDSC